MKSCWREEKDQELCFYSWHFKYGSANRSRFLRHLKTLNVQIRGAVPEDFNIYMPITLCTIRN